MGWLYFAFVQAVMCVLMVFGWFVLLLPAVLRRWRQGTATEGRQIMVWRARWLNAAYGNPADGVLPAWPVVWSNGFLVPYRPGQPAWLRAYMWSAWRNSVDNLKYDFRWPGGPFKRWEFSVFGHPLYAQLGWNSHGLPVMSAGGR